MGRSVIKTNETMDHIPDRIPKMLTKKEMTQDSNGITGARYPSQSACVPV